ncbi:MAG: hypothetical protein FIO04_05445 [Nitrosopumilales archaeon]|nr:hypothetical protein [Nitrosopumilales archaeon]
MNSCDGVAPFGHGNFPFPQSASGRVLARIAGRHGRTPRQVALNFLARHPCISRLPTPAGRSK